MEKLKASVRVNAFGRTPEGMLDLMRKNCPDGLMTGKGGRLPWAYERLIEVDPELAQELVQFVVDSNLDAYCNGIRHGVELAAQGLPLDKEGKVRVEVIVR